MTEIGRLIIISGIFLVVIGIVMMLFGNIGIPRLPGDIFIKKDNVTFYFPIVTSILLSIILSIILNLFVRR